MSLVGKFMPQRKWATTGFHGSNKQSYKISLLVGWFYDLQKEEEKFGLAGKRSQTLIICWLFVWLMETKLIFWSLIIKDWTWNKKSWIISSVQKMQVYPTAAAQWYNTFLNIPRSRVQVQLLSQAPIEKMVKN